MNSITKLQPDWWVRVPEAERRFLRVLMGTIQEAEEQGPPEVAGFAREWERSLGCFIKTRLRNRKDLAVGHRRRRRAECKTKIHLTLGKVRSGECGVRNEKTTSPRPSPQSGEGERMAA